MKRRLIILAAIVGASIGAGAVRAAGEPTTPSFGSDGYLVTERVGAVCTYALFSVVQEVARRCPEGGDPAYRAALEAEMGRLELHIQQTTGATSDDLAQFRRQQGNHDSADGFVCSGFSLQLWRGMVAAGSDTLKRTVDRLVARPGPAEWGDCL